MHLDDHETRDPIAQTCRAAVLEFVNGVTHGWGKREMARWLVNRYEPLTFHADAESERKSADRPTVEAPVAPAGPLDDDRLVDVLFDARDEIVDLMLALTTPGRVEDFGFSALLRGWVVVLPSDEGVTWAPAQRPGMRLADRLSSLVAIDYLLRSIDYESRLEVCDACDTPRFHTDAHADDSCPTCQRGSGYPQWEADVPTLPGVGKLAKTG